MRKIASLLLILGIVLFITSLVPVQAQTPAWAPGVSYAVGAQVTYQDATHPNHLYKCLQAHVSQVGWEPATTPALWQDLGPTGGTSPTATPTSSGSGNGSPYGGTAVSIPGRIQAENYNTGGEGVAYHDAEATNQGGQYRTAEGVDIEATTDSGGGYNVGWTATGEWEKYTVNVTSGGTYTLDFRVASAQAGSSLHLEVDGTNVSGTLAVPNTGGWQTWTDVTKTGVSLSAGSHVLRIFIDAGGMNINWLNIAQSSGPTPTFAPPTPTSPASGNGNPYNGTPANIPGTVQAENYNTGGEGVAYHDAEATNQGGQYRTAEGVDIEATTDSGGGYNVGWTATGEWEKYTVNVTAGGTYNLDFRVASAQAGSSLHLEVDGANVSGTLAVPNTGGWQTWTDVTKTGVSLSAGSHVLRIFIDAGGMNVNWFSIGSGSVATATPVPPPPPPGKVFAPYIDVSPGSTSPIMQLASNGSGNKHYTLAFILGRGCAASWFGTFTMDTTEAAGIGQRINELRAAGGDVIVSFGGAAAPELANVCSDAASLQAQYQAVVSKYSLNTIDLDIEDFNTTAIDLRNKALKGLEAANPNLKVHYTLGVLQSGMTQSQLDVLNNAKANGTRVDMVNIMAMDYGGAVSDMYAAAVSAAQGARSQLNSMGFTSTQLGITPMIGVNDSAGETFSLANASSLVSWANSNGIALLAFWSVGRDNGGCPGGGAASATCSGVSQSTWQFSSIFRGFAN